ncbi:MAG TPA: MBL fold metallo-hydrolase [candidate division Zixibacteria bacterium]|nr:MBL fold metallo-hydrolase [candidate division Zixibacteria bacterium]
MSTKTIIKIVYDNEATKGYISGWGFSAIIQKNSKTILFDTGWDGIALIKNLEQSNIHTEEIDYIVISHNHWDHLGGLSTILNSSKSPEVFVPKSSFSSNLKAEITRFGGIREIGEKFEELNEGVFITPELKTEIEGVTEISLMVQTKRGFVLICGCSHPGLDKIIDKAQFKGKIYAVIGGFHGFEKLEKLKEIELIIPCHCTRKKKEILNEYTENAKECFSGLELIFD